MVVLLVNKILLSDCLTFCKHEHQQSASQSDSDIYSPVPNWLAIYLSTDSLKCYNIELDS